MKKSILVIVIAIVCMAFAVPVFAAGTTFNGPIGTTVAVTTVIGGATFAPSTGVYINISSTTTAYCVSAIHSSAVGKDAGKDYASTSDSATIFYKPAAALTAVIECDAAGVTATLPGGATGWKQ